MNRRDFLRASGALTARAVVGSSLWSLSCGLALTGESPYGPLLPPDANGIMLPEGFSSRVVARTGQAVPGTGYRWHGAPDGGAVFPARDRGWIYVCNSELSRGGGAGALRFDRAGRVVDAYRICEGTRRNCAGGATPWGTWLSCEEVPGGQVFECDPEGLRAPVAQPALGSFVHEAVAVAPLGRRLYLTEDTPIGRFYRFTPNRWGDLSGGVLEAAEHRPDGRVVWHRVPDPNPAVGATPTALQVPESTPFAGGEGIVYQRGHVTFTTKGDDRVWDYQLFGGRLSILYDAALDPGRQLTGVDNVTAARSGDLLVAEDGGNMELVLLTPDRIAAALLRVTGQGGSELTGPAFDPSGRRLYFSSQRPGTTYEVTGPFRRHAHPSGRGSR